MTILLLLAFLALLNPSPAQSVLGAEAEQPSTDDLMAAIRLDPMVHFCACAKIKKKDGKVEAPQEPNTLQVRLFRAYAWLQERGLPINLILLKPRQSGGSEGTAQLCYHHSRRFNLSGFMMADTHDRTDKIWQLFTQKSKPGMDEYGPYWGNQFKANTEQAKILFKDDTGMKCEAVWDRGTANDSKAGASGTRQIIWLSEDARYAKDGAFKDSTVIGNALNSIPPDLPNTMRIAESTAEGSGGWHFDTFEGAVTLEERQAGRVGNGWIKIFVGWHECDDYTLADLPQNAEFFDDDKADWTPYREDEEAGRIRYGWTRERIAWRRKKIVSDLGGDAKLFKRDYPASAEEAWSSSGTKKFNVIAVARMLKEAEHLWNRTMRGDLMAPKMGSLNEGATNTTTWLPAKEDAWLWVLEPPEYNRSYSLVVDPMTGEQAAGSDKPDNHAPMVIRKAYIDPQGVHHRAEVVAAIYQPNGCRWDMDVLADRVALLSRWYGRCIVVNEVNKAMDLVPLLQARNVTLYRRRARPDIVNPSERQMIVGFYSDTSTRQMWVTSAAETIREGTVGCLFLPAVKEFDTFIVNPKGKAEAATGAHDDWVAAFGIGVLTIESATRMILVPVRQMHQPKSRQSPLHYGRLGSGAIS